MKPWTVLGIYREKRFSPGKVEADAAILDATLAELAQSGWSTTVLAGERLDTADGKPALVVSMAQSDQALRILEQWSREGVRVVNSAQSIRNCYRKPQIHLLQTAQLPLPFSQIVSLQSLDPAAGFPPAAGRFWLKRGDVHAMQAQDVVCVTGPEEMQQAVTYFAQQRVTDILLQDHVEGSVVKFYGVVKRAFFQAFLAHSGKDITAEVHSLLDIAQQAAQVTGLEVYGGDAVITPDNEVVLIDLNDWPSFSRCCRAAAKSIANYLIDTQEEHNFSSISKQATERHTTDRIADFKTT